MAETVPRGCHPGPHAVGEDGPSVRRPVTPHPQYTPHELEHWLRGGTLESRLRRRRLDADESVTLATQSGSALATAHHAGVEHRDIRAANVFVDGVGNNYLGDFGIAVAADDDATRAGADDVRGLGSVLDLQPFRKGDDRCIDRPSPRPWYVSMRSIYRAQSSTV